jgi:uncharacterized protein (TIGR03437 family)
MRYGRNLFCAMLGIATCGRLAFGQAPPITLLKLDIDNYVSYINDVSEFSKLASDPNKTTSLPFRTFGTIVQIADIVAVNDKPAKGTLTQRSIGLGLTPNARPGGVFPNSAIADTVRQNMVEICFEVLGADGTPIGTIMAQGLSQGSSPPGAPLVQTGDNVTVVGGTGAFLGARGQVGLTAATPSRTASASEDPANRRLNGGAKRSFILSLVPISLPEIVSTVSGPAVVHANDFTLVTAANPAKAGETLTLFAYGMGPTRPGVDPGTPFPASPQALVNSPVEVTASGAPAAVLYAGGYPGAVNAYQVNFTLPPDIKPGSASLQLKVAWIAGLGATISIR